MIRIVGDAHGRLSEYKAIVRDVPHSVQVGDLAFNYDEILDLDPTAHKFVPGNHDNYDRLPPHSLGDFGQTELGGITFFFVRGAFSIDKKYRIDGRDWWPNEELSRAQVDECKTLYEQVRPQIVISHDCPTFISRQLFPSDILRNFGYNPETFQTRTGNFLEELHDIHQPSLHFFGHYHLNKTTFARGTRFICIGELQYLDLDPNDLC